MEKLSALLGLISGLLFSIEIIGDTRMTRLEAWLESAMGRAHSALAEMSFMVMGRAPLPPMQRVWEKKLLRIAGVVAAVLSLAFSAIACYIWFYYFPERVVPRYFGTDERGFWREYWYWMLLAFISYFVILMTSGALLMRQQPWQSENSVLSFLLSTMWVLLQVAAALVLVLCLLAALVLLSGPYLIIAPAIILLWVAASFLVGLFRLRRRYELANVFKLLGGAFFAMSAMLLVLSWL